MQKDAETIKRELARPFAPEDLEWRLQQAYEDKERGLAVPYVTNRAIQDRLDEVVGPDNWHNEYKPWHQYTVKVRSKETKAYEEKSVDSQLCGISIYFEGRGFITKWDGANDSDIEPVKGGLSDSMKRAAVQWGIGRVLYKMDTVWVDIERRGRTWIIKASERQKLDRTYLETLRRLGLEPAKPGGLQSQLTPTPDRTAPRQETAEPRNDPAQRQESAPAGNRQGNAPQPEQPPRGNTPVHTQGAPEQPKAEFVIADARIQNNMSGTSTSLVLTEPGGKKALAFVQGSHPELKKGMGLFNVKKQLKQQDSVVFYLLSGYDCLEQDAA